MKKKQRESKDLHDGYSDGFTPLEPLDLGRVATVSDLVAAMGKTAFGGRAVGEAAEVLERMVRQQDVFVVLTVSGAMTVAKQGLVICDMIENDMVDTVISTGALMAHGLIEAQGMTHFKYDSTMKDEELYEKGYDRVYDTLELESNLDDTELFVRPILARLDPKQPVSSHVLTREIGKELKKQFPDRRSILGAAYAYEVPVYVPAFTDSELGLDFALANRRRRAANQPTVTYDPTIDLDHYTENVKQQKVLGIFTIGGGVPRNWAQQVGPYLDIMEKRGVEGGDFKRFQYAVRICPEPVHWGGLSGCTYSEGVSWGKFAPATEGGRFAEVYCDATIAFPLIVKAVLERLGRGK